MAHLSKLSNLQSNNLLVGNICNRMDKKVANEDGNYVNPQLCASYATDIYKHLRESEVFHLYTGFAVSIYTHTHTQVFIRKLMDKKVVRSLWCRSYLLCFLNFLPF